MASPEDRPTNWRTDAESARGSGGRRHPDLASDPGDPLGSLPSDRSERFDPLTAPLPSELHRLESERAASTRPERTDVVPRGARPPERAQAQRRTGSEGQPRRIRPAVRRVRRTVRTIDPMSVLKLSLFCYTVFLVLWLVFVAIVYTIADARGLFDWVEDVGRGFAFWEDFEVSLLFVERWAFLIGLTLVVLGSLLNAFLAFLYNLAADIVGGAEMTFVEREL